MNLCLSLYCSLLASYRPKIEFYGKTCERFVMNISVVDVTDRIVYFHAIAISKFFFVMAKFMTEHFVADPSQHSLVD